MNIVYDVLQVCARADCPWEVDGQRVKKLARRVGITARPTMRKLKRGLRFKLRKKFGQRRSVFEAVTTPLSTRSDISGYTPHRTASPGTASNASWYICVLSDDESTARVSDPLPAIEVSSTTL